MLSETEKHARLRLARSDNVGPVTFRHLLERYQTAEKALQALPGLARKGGARSIRIADKEAIDREFQIAREMGVIHLFAADIGFPRQLCHIHDTPPVLLCRGDTQLLKQDCIAVAGARNASSAGIAFARRLARGLTQAGLCVVSGFARGIDTGAHEGALEHGATIGVLASGIDVVYPRENIKLYDRICAEGLFVSEHAPGEEPKAKNFPKRNRIVSGLSCGVVIVEATKRSGSLITARLALEQGREVMAVPGPPNDPRSDGTNSLIQQGAALIQNVDDVLDAIRLGGQQETSEPEILYHQQTTNWQVDEDKRRAIRNCLSQAPVEVDEITRQTGFGAHVVHTVLLELELAGRLQRHAGGRVSLVDELLS